MRRCLCIIGLMGGAALAWSLLAWWVPSGSERFYLLVPPFALACVLVHSPQGWRMLPCQLPRLLRPLATLILLAGAYNLYLARLALPPGHGGWLRGMDAREVATAVCFLAAVGLILSLPLRLMRQLRDRWLLRGESNSPPLPVWRAWLRTNLLELLLVPFILPYVISTMFVHRFKLPSCVTPLQAAERPYEDVAFVTEDGLTIRGWFIPAVAEGSPRSMIICHGLGANRSNFLPFLAAGDAIEANILMFDFRGHGDSDGHTVSFGWHEEQDVRAAVAYLRRERSSQAREVIGLGISMGSSGLIRAAARVEPPFRAVIVDSGFASAVELTDGVLRPFPAFFRPLLSTPGVPLASLEAGCWLPAVRPEDDIARLRCPLLVIHSGHDDLIPIDHAYRLYQRAGEPKSLWIAGTLGHATAVVAGSEYARRLRQIVDTAMP